MSMEHDFNAALDNRVQTQSEGLRAISTLRERLLVGMKAKAAEARPKKSPEVVERTIVAAVDAQVDGLISEAKAEIAGTVNEQHGDVLRGIEVPNWLAGLALRKRFGL